MNAVDHWLAIPFALAQTGEPLRDGISWPVWMSTVLVCGLCVWMHFETIRWLVVHMTGRVRSFRWAMLSTVFTLLVLHLAEIMLFGVVYYGLIGIWGQTIGAFDGAYDGTLGDTIYFSFAVYTTVGFGDITPTGPLRIIAGVEALVGLVLITWSASFTFLIMQGHWRELYASSKTSEPDAPHHS